VSALSQNRQVSQLLTAGGEKNDVRMVRAANRRAGDPGHRRDPRAATSLAAVRKSVAYLSRRAVRGTSPMQIPHFINQHGIKRPQCVALRRINVACEARSRQVHVQMPGV